MLNDLPAAPLTFRAVDPMTVYPHWDIDGTLSVRVERAESQEITVNRAYHGVLNPDGTWDEWQYVP